MDRAYYTDEGYEKWIKSFNQETWKEETTWEILSIDGMIILKWMLKETWCEIVNWIHLTQDKAQW